MVAVVKKKETPTVKPVTTSEPKVTKVEKPVVTKVTANPKISVEGISALAANVTPRTSTVQAVSPAIPAVGAVLQKSRDEEVNNKMLRLTPEEAAEIEAAEVEEENDDEAPEQAEGGSKKKIIIAVVVAVVVMAVVVLLINRRKRK